MEYWAGFFSLCGQGILQKRSGMDTGKGQFNHVPHSNNL
jgi:hypothetical protein